jgi:CRISPR-associated protein Csh2
MADDRAEEIIGSLSGDAIKSLAIATFDVPLFGALVTIRKGKDKKGKDKDSGSQKLTGPVQFAIGRSVNQVQILNPQITSRFVGKEKKNEAQGDDQQPDQHGTIGKFYAVDYALIKIQGAVNPANLGEYLEDAAVVESFKKAENKLFNCLWEGTNALITRSKFPQRSIFLLEVTYDSSIYNDLPVLIEEDPTLKGRVSGLTGSPLKFNGLLEALKTRKAKVQKVRLASCRELLKDTKQLKANIEALGIPVELVSTEEPLGATAS